MITSPRPSRQSPKNRNPRPSKGRPRSAPQARQEPSRLAWAGLDVSKADFEAAFAPRPAPAGCAEPLEGMITQGFERTPVDASRFLAWTYGHLPPGMQLAVIMEATGRYSKELAAWLRETDDSLRVIIADPYKIHHFAESLGTRNNTDKVDARVIARFGVDRAPEPPPEPDSDYVCLRELTRDRRRLVEDRVRLENRMGEGTPLAFIQTQWEEQLDLLQRQEKALDAEIEKLIRESELLRRDNEAMRQVAGVGPIVASTIQAEAGDPRRFPSARAFVAFCGLAPNRKESGTSVKRSKKRCKHGSPRLRQVLYMAAMAALRAKKPNRFQAYQQQRKSNGLAGKGTILGVQRKMLSTLFCITTREEPYQDSHKPHGSATTGKQR